MHPNCRFVFSINAISKADSVIVTRDIHRSFSFTFNLNDYLYGFSSKNDIKAHTCRCAQLRLNNPFTEKKVVDVISATLNRVADIIRSIKAVFAYVLKIAKWIEKNVYLRHKEAAYGCDSYIHMFFFCSCPLAHYQILLNGFLFDNIAFQGIWFCAGVSPHRPMFCVLQYLLEKQTLNILSGIQSTRNKRRQTAIWERISQRWAYGEHQQQEICIWI